MRPEIKVGIFALAGLLIIGFITLKVGSRSFFLSGGYEVSVTVDNAIGIRAKTPVEIAGIKIGKVKEIELINSRRARLTLAIDSDVTLPADTKVLIRSKGFLGEIVVELIPGDNEGEKVVDGGALEFAGQGGDVNMLLMQFSSIANDIKSVSTQLKGMVGNDENSPVWSIVKNLETFTQTLANNQANFNKMAGNLAELTESLKGTIVKSRENVEESLQRIASITKKVDEGQGTVGKLVNDDTTVKKLNEVADNLNDTLGGLRRMETEIGYHTEYQTTTDRFKSYVNLTLKPKPDKAFIFEFVQDPRPAPTYQQRTTDVTVGGATTSIQTETSTVDQNSFRVSAEIAKSFYDFTIRGGIIESSGGVGLDYNKGPVGVQMEAFSLQTNNNQRPHLKAMGLLNVTSNIYLVGGADDFINKQQSVDWFFGAGIRLADDDIKSLVGMGAASSLKK